MADRPVRLNAPPETLTEDPALAELMSPRLLGVTPDASLAVALRLLLDAGVRHLPVLQGAHCLGVLTEADLVRALVGPEPGLGLWPVVGQLCRTAAVLGPTQPRSAAASAMHRTGVDAVLVVEDGLLLGIVTATDVVRSLADRSGAGGTRGPAAGATPREPVR